MCESAYYGVDLINTCQTAAAKSDGPVLCNEEKKALIADRLPGEKGTATAESNKFSQ